MNDLRRLTDIEKQIIAKLLSVNFPGKDELRVQFANCRVKRYDGDPYSMHVFPAEGSPAAPVESTMPVEALYTDTDGHDVSIMLHLKSTGFVYEVHIFKHSGHEIFSQPNIESLSVWRDGTQGLP